MAGIRLRSGFLAWRCSGRLHAHGALVISFHTACPKGRKEYSKTEPGRKEDTSGHSPAQRLRARPLTLWLAPITGYPDWETGGFVAHRGHPEDFGQDTPRFAGTRRGGWGPHCVSLQWLSGYLGPQRHQETLAYHVLTASHWGRWSTREWPGGQRSLQVSGLHSNCRGRQLAQSAAETVRSARGKKQKTNT